MRKSTTGPSSGRAAIAPDQAWTPTSGRVPPCGRPQPHGSGSRRAKAGAVPRAARPATTSRSSSATGLPMNLRHLLEAEFQIAAEGTGKAEPWSDRSHLRPSGRCLPESSHRVHSDSATLLIAARVAGIPWWAASVRSAICAGASSPNRSSNLAIPPGRNSHDSVTSVPSSTGVKV